MVMSVKLELLSTNIVQIIERCANSTNLAKLLYYNDSVNPMSNEVVPANVIAPFGSKERILPYPFDIRFKDEQRSQLHIYYPDLKFVNNAQVETGIVWFDIIVHKRLWLYSQDGKKLVRPYEIASEVTKLFDGTIPNTKSTVGNLDFLALGHVSVNEEFDAVRLEAKMTTF
jgi:hypothetical protein